MIEMRAKMVALDQNNQCVVVLTDLQEKMILPIWIGLLEAHAITMSLAGENPSRPLTHDLFTMLCQETQSTIDQIIITDLTEDGTFIAEIYLSCRGEKLVIDSRPSDAIALALRNNAKMFMDEKLVEFTHSPEDFTPPDTEDETLH